MKTLDLFSGIGGFALGFQQAGGFEMAAYCELDDKAAAVFGHHWPDVPNMRDVREVTKDAIEPMGRIDVITGGFPCQDLSVAGRREGLAGERSGLWFEYHRIIDELKPQWVVIENVPGLLSSNGGADFAIVLRGLVECGYGVAWRVLDAQYYGVAQRRRRVFIVGSLGDGRAAQVLFEREGVSWNPPARGEAGQGATADAADGSGIAGTVSTKWAKGTGGPAGDELYNLVSSSVAPTLPASGAGTARTGNERTEAELLVCGVTDLTHGENQRRRIYAPDGLAPNLQAEEGRGHGVPSVLSFEPRYYSDRKRMGGAPSEVAQTLKASDVIGGDEVQRVAHNAAVRRLTPTECERLQGFPDGWTAESTTGPQSDSARYKQLGNAVAVPVARWIAERIRAVSE